MKILKRLLIGLAVLIAIPFVVALFVKKEFEVVQSVVVDRPRADAFAYVKQAGGVPAWDAAHPERGRGTQEIKKATEPERIESEIRFTAPFTGTSAGATTFEVIDPAHTRVQVSLKGQLDYPWNLLAASVADQVGRDTAASLIGIKSALEKR